MNGKNAQTQPETKSRAKRAALVLLLLGIAGVSLFLALRRPALLPAVALAQMTEFPEIMPADTPPLKPGAGWPFAQLPHIAKFEAPVPRMSMTLLPGPLVPEKVNVPQWPPPPQAPGNAPLWVLAPLAAGAYVVSADVSGQSVVPEPATVVLLATGMLLMGMQVMLRRRQLTAPNWSVTRGGGRKPRPPL